MSLWHLFWLIVGGVTAPMAVLCIISYWLGRFDERSDIRNRARHRAEGLLARKQHQGIRL